MIVDFLVYVICYAFSVFIFEKIFQNYLEERKEKAEIVDRVVSNLKGESLKMKEPTNPANSLKNVRNLQNSLEEKVKGVIFGQAIGDAIGLATEFMNKQEINFRYGSLSSKSIEYEFITQGKKDEAQSDCFSIQILLEIRLS